MHLKWHWSLENYGVFREASEYSIINFQAGKGEVWKPEFLLNTSPQFSSEEEHWSLFQFFVILFVFKVRLWTATMVGYNQAQTSLEFISVKYSIEGMF